MKVTSYLHFKGKKVHYPVQQQELAWIGWTGLLLSSLVGALVPVIIFYFML